MAAGADEARDRGAEQRQPANGLIRLEFVMLGDGGSAEDVLQAAFLGLLSDRSAGLAGLLVTDHGQGQGPAGNH
jgi:hypothetical protein